MTRKLHPWSLAALPLAIGLASVSSTANAYNFSIGDVRGQIDSQMSVGMSVSTTNADSRFIHVESGGQAAARTSDDGRLNYRRGDIFSKIFKGSHDLELRYGNSGAFVRGNYWYDFETKDGSQRFYDISDSGRDPLQKGSGVQLLDAFVYHNYAIGSNPGNVRLGRQVVSWGEGLFIQNGINSINPIDVSAFRRPGAELKEGLLPVEMLYLNQGLTMNLSMEAFYQLKWAPTVVDNCGTFFGGDVAAKGCTDRLVVNGPDMPQGEVAPGAYISRADKDRDARDDGQWGVAFRYFAPQLNDTEFGLFAMNYHSRNPYYNGVAGNLFAGGAGVPGYQGDLGAAGYYFDYPEDIRLYGVSFQTDVGGASVAGEVSYRPNMPLQINTGDMSRTALQIGPDSTHRDLVGLETGTEIRGYERKEFWQAQVSAVHFIDRVLGASRLSLVGEVGANWIGGLGSGDGTTKFGRDSLFGQSRMADGSCFSEGVGRGDSWCENDGYFTSFSWGYRARASLDYSNVFRGVNLSPNIAFSHDVEGYSPNFVENAKSVSVGVAADYGNKYNASLSYTTFFDGKYNTMVDRDFAAVSFGVSF
ncbi:MAG: DUF1302 domain-containing protein [Pseudomonadaceae bacterium]|nr:MAG: DUF1302 domain-containing protein [Pseudomonadaceae bacterium]